MLFRDAPARNRSILTIIIMLLVTALSTGTLYAIGERDKPGPDTSNPDLAPDFTFTTFDGDTMTLADLRGKVVVLNFWASWCAPCRAETPALQQVWEEYQDRNVVILGIAVWDEVIAARVFIDQYHVTYPVAMDPDDVAGLYGIQAVPTTYIIDTAGKISQQQIGGMDEEMLLQMLTADIGVTEKAPEIAAPVPEWSNRYADTPQRLTEDGYPQLGDLNAPVAVNIYLSFSCSFCLNFYDTAMGELLETYIQEGTILLTYVPIYNTGEIPNGWEANRASLCAAEQDTFWPYADMLFHWHATIGDTAFDTARLKQGTRTLGLDVDAWDSCMASTRPDRVLEQAVQELTNLSPIYGTPTVTVNGEQIAASLNTLYEAINAITGDPF